MKKLLILGGTRQVGRRLIEIIQENYSNDFDITLFNRGKTNPHLFPDVTKIIGDRTTDAIEQIFDKNWDIVLDCTAYEPFSVRKILLGLKGKIAHYILISTISVYDIPNDVKEDLQINETFPLKKVREEQLTTKGLKFYGQKKVAAELELLNSDVPQKVILRPHYLFGKYDFQNTDYYWINRIKKYNTLVLPNAGNDLIHRSYMEDFISIILSSFSYSGNQIIFNATTHNPHSLKSYLNTIQTYFNKDITYLNASNNFLIKHNVRPFFGLTFWNNTANITYDNQGLIQELHPKLTIAESAIQQTINLENAGNSWANGKLGLSRERELELIKLL